MKLGLGIAFSIILLLELITRIFLYLEDRKMTFNKLLEKLDKTISNNNSAEAVRLMKKHVTLILTNKEAFAEWLENKQKGGEI